MVYGDAANEEIRRMFRNSFVRRRTGLRGVSIDHSNTTYKSVKKIPRVYITINTDASLRFAVVNNNDRVPYTLYSLWQNILNNMLLCLNDFCLLMHLFLCG